MKKLLLLFILILPLTVFSQKKSIDGFLDIPFGSDSVTVIKTLLSKGSKKVGSLSNEGVMKFTGFEFSDRKAFECEVRFVDNKAYQLNLSFTDFDEKDVLYYYDNFSNDITSVYGNGILADNFGDENDLTKIRRLKLGSNFVHTTWQAKNKNTVRIQIVTDDQQSLLIMLEYQDNDLWMVNAAKRRADL